MVVDETILLELKAVERVLPLHESQVLTYLKLSGLPVGLLLNFNVHRMRSGIHVMYADPHIPSHSVFPVLLSVLCEELLT